MVSLSLCELDTRESTGFPEQLNELLHDKKRAKRLQLLPGGKWDQ